MNKYEKQVAKLRRVAKEHESAYGGATEESELLRETAGLMAELVKAARGMHLWIFENVEDEEAAYRACGLSPQMDAELGYLGRDKLG